MAICVETIQKQNPQDVRTPVFIFERLCSIIYPEENDIGEFFLTLEKDPQQEDFLQVSISSICHFYTRLEHNLPAD
jgi:E3 ubiquitin-protein ligase UBR4